ncbi:hypothetical protein OGAPHI_006530 [Ogataea philodendri]|uniref:Carboxypeptidase n=1 Tax=Ogataea philodendri TaxID=1378263 RepID=A0A9P8NXP4_9ASCO|nr:uncharacterized protein OGAPHI_006530 [Ogataea philodendri]KAH3661680.1 hypothetical protein OGAPHI_006530 [Ogataea philodendri]
MNYLGFLVFALVVHLVRGSQNDYIVKNLPGLDKIPVGKQPIMHAGHLEIFPENNTDIFFWRFSDPVRNKTHKKLHGDDLVIWLNGGPGCSSMDGALMEIGPLRITKDAQVEANPGSWTEVADVVFVDQPAGTGFSYTDKFDTELDDAARDFGEFLKRYFELFPEDSTKNIWLAGESYAGQYIPHFATYIVEHRLLDLKLKGLLIGNGWIEPNLQSLAYVPFALDNGLIDSKAEYMNHLLKKHEKCQKAINDPNNNDFEAEACSDVIMALLKDTRDKSKPADQQCYNIYDYRKHDSYPSCGNSWPEKLPVVTEFLNTDSVQESLNLKIRKTWRECDGKVGLKFHPKKSRISFDLLPKLLEQMTVMLFAGDKDIICNYKSIEMLIDKLEITKGQTGFGDSSPVDWVYDSSSVGKVHSDHNLTYVKVYNSSHMVPYDLPAVSRGLFDIMTGVVEKRDGALLTPVYDSDGNYEFVGLGDRAKDGSSNDQEVNQHHSISFYIAEMVILAVLAYLLCCFYKSFNKNQKSSFLRFGSKKKKKQVHWFDERDLEPETQQEPDDKPKSMLEAVFSKLGYGTQYDKVLNQTDIEMTGGPQSEDQFIVQSDEEEFGHN